ncbi:MAG: hypothetical protein KIT27_08205 [Legionellales bacterium]|nr:hypothetical protein [Legionellales bacterium]
MNKFLRYCAIVFLMIPGLSLADTPPSAQSLACNIIFSECCPSACVQHYQHDIDNKYSATESVAYKKLMRTLNAQIPIYRSPHKNNDDTLGVDSFPAFSQPITNKNTQPAPGNTINNHFNTQRYPNPQPVTAPPPSGGFNVDNDNNFSNPPQPGTYQ